MYTETGLTLFALSRETLERLKSNGWLFTSGEVTGFWQKLWNVPKFSNVRYILIDIITYVNAYVNVNIMKMPQNAEFYCKVKSESTDDLAFLLKHYKKKSQGIIA